MAKGRTISLEQALVRSGAEVRHHGTDSDEISINCPYCEQNGHSRDTKFRLGINTKNGKAHCFHCHWRTSNIYKLLGEQVGAVVRKPDKHIKAETSVKITLELPESYEEIGQGEGMYVRRAQKYLLDRGISQQQISDYRLGTASVGRYGGRVIFPVWHHGKLLSIIGRSISPNLEPRFLNERVPKPLWNCEAVERAKVVVIYEGIIKALAGERACSGRYGHTNVAHTASLGTDLSDFQRSFIPKHATVIMYPDPGSVGRKAFLKIGRSLTTGRVVRVVSPLPDVEADEDDLRDVSSRIYHAQPFNLMRWRLMSSFVE